MGLRWRLLLDGPESGPWNMGVDEALLATAQSGAPDAATLRLYAWKGPWLSLGYGQTPSVERLRACAAADVGVVQRTTGGAAVLHGCDLTYAVTAPADRLPPGLRGSYALISQVVARALGSLGVEAQPAGPPRAGSAAAERPFDCFAMPAPEELVAAGRKLVGSAQRRAGGALLQHGSLRLAADPPAAARAAQMAPERAGSLAGLGLHVSPDAVAGAFVRAFEQVLGVSPEPGALSSEERARAARRGAFPRAAAS